MTQSRQTPRVWSDAIRGSEILSNWVKLGTNAVLLWLSVGIGLGAVVGGFWFFEGTTSLDRRLWIHHVRNGLGMGGRIANLPNPDGSGTRMQVHKNLVRRYTLRSYEIVSRRFQESAFSGSFWLSAGRLLQPSSCARAADRRPRTSTSVGPRWLPSRLSWRSSALPGSRMTSPRPACPCFAKQRPTTCLTFRTSPVAFPGNFRAAPRGQRRSGRPESMRRSVSISQVRISFCSFR
jgi:hypothetical protein